MGSRAEVEDRRSEEEGETGGQGEVKARDRERKRRLVSERHG